MYYWGFTTHVLLGVHYTCIIGGSLHTLLLGVNYTCIIGGSLHTLLLVDFY